LPKVLFEGNERHLKFKNIIQHYIIFLHCIPQWKKTSSVVSHKGGNLPPFYPTTEETWKWKLSSIVGYNRRKPAVLWDAMRKIFLCCIP
jgi:hypothetical protein